MGSTSSIDATFWDHVAPLLASGGAEEGTMMGERCLRVKGAFLAKPHHVDGALVVKLPKDRVAGLIREGRGEAFVPHGRALKEWVHIRVYDAALWDQLLAEGQEFVTR